MSREWKPGDVALVRGKVCIRSQGKWEHGLDDRFAFDDDDAARPLVVIDPEDMTDVERVRDALWTGGVLGRWQQNLRSLTTPPRPPEPLGLGAVVEDEGGVLHVRAGRHFHPWRSVRSNGVAQWTDYGDITAVRVLSEGVVQP